ncbi:hypothetical protein DYB30_011211 [Aphanomyces astaci]|uniref:Uncharacterized protein n=1 Tax=Aphanomyces astaci TaxID=112090 RepID=A0A397CCS3_APHAT|nr:hypothetical protein DYB30_011211 [Aphanomyces astaci]
MGFGATVLDIVSTTFVAILDTYVSYAIHYWVLLVLLVVVALGCGRHATAKNDTFLIMATSCTGAFAVSSGIVAAIDVIFNLRSVVAHLAILLGVGVALMVAGMFHQKAALNKLNAPLPIATPVNDKLDY